MNRLSWDGGTREKSFPLQLYLWEVIHRLLGVPRDHRVVLEGTNYHQSLLHRLPKGSVELLLRRASDSERRELPEESSGPIHRIWPSIWPEARLEDFLYKHNTVSIDSIMGIVFWDSRGAYRERSAKVALDGEEGVYTRGILACVHAALVFYRRAFSRESVRPGCDGLGL